MLTLSSGFLSLYLALLLPVTDVTTPRPAGEPSNPAVVGPASPEKGLLLSFEPPAGDPAFLPLAGNAPPPEPVENPLLGASSLGQTAGVYSDPNREGKFALNAGLGFMLDPDDFLLGFSMDYYLKHNLTVGALFQIGVDDRPFVLAPSINFKGVLDIDTPALRALKPFIQGGLGLAYLHRERRHRDDDDVGFMVNFGFGFDYYITDEFSLGSNLLFNGLAEDTLGEDFFFSWQVVTASFHFG